LLEREDVRGLRLEEIRARIRAGEYAGPTSGLAPGHVQTNLVVLPEEYAFDFLKFCVRNPKPCPVLEVTDAGSPTPGVMAPEADLRLVDSYSECLELVQNGAVDAVSTDDVILTGMIIQDDSLKLVGDELTTEPYGAGIKEGDKEFQEFVSSVIADWKESGGWQEAYDKWVGQYTDEEQEPPTMTLQEALELTP